MKYLVLCHIWAYDAIVLICSKVTLCPLLTTDMLFINRLSTDKNSSPWASISSYRLFNRLKTSIRLFSSSTL